MAFVLTNSDKIGYQPVADTSTVQNHPLGTIAKGYDPTLGGGEFIYLKGVASTVVGSPVTYTGAFQTALTTDTANLATPLAIAMSVNVASQYGWYQISGAAVVKKAAVSINPGVKLYIGAAAVTNVSATGKGINGLKAGNAATVASATGTITVICNRPSLVAPLITS